MKKKLTVIFLCVALAAIAIVGASLAYFTDTKSVTNTFTVGKVKIDLIESKFHRQGSGSSGDTSIPAPTQTASGMKYVSDGATIFTDEEIKADARITLPTSVSGEKTWSPARTLPSPLMSSTPARMTPTSASV